jgi:hypothetical protein
MGKGGSVSVEERIAMFEDAPVNTGAVVWPDEDLAYMTVRRMQIKLHRWASRHGGLTNGKDTWSARCVETRTPGAVSGPGKRTVRKDSTAPRPDSTAS